MIIVMDVSSMSDDQLAFYGWIRIYDDSVSDYYWNPGYNEVQPVTKVAPRFLVIDDINDARFMERDGALIIRGPRF